MAAQAIAAAKANPQTVRVIESISLAGAYQVCASAQWQGSSLVQAR